MGHKGGPRESNLLTSSKPSAPPAKANGATGPIAMPIPTPIGATPAANGGTHGAVAGHPVVHVHPHGVSHGPPQANGDVAIDVPQLPHGEKSGVKKSGSGKSDTPVHGMTLPFQALSLTFHNMNYFVPLPKVHLPLPPS
jgi:hypothetical protein